MVILLQSVTIQFRRVFLHISYNKVRQSNFITKYGRLILQSVSGITKCDRLFITKCVRYYKVWQTLLQSASGITQCDSYYKVRHKRGCKVPSQEVFHQKTKSTSKLSILKLLSCSRISLAKLKVSSIEKLRKLRRYEKSFGSKAINLTSIPGMISIF